MAEVRPTFIDAAGYPEDADPSADTVTWAGLTMGGDIAMGGNKTTGMADGVAGGDGVNVSQLDQAVITGGSAKEAILHATQLSDANGILAAAALTFAAQPVSGDTISITDGSTTRTYGAASGGDVQYAIGGSVAITMQNFADAVEGDGSAIWGAVFTANLDAIDSDGVVVLVEDSAAGTVPRVFGTWATPANIQHVDFDTLLDYTSKVLTDLDSADPTASNPNFGIRRVQASLVDGEIHYSLESDELRSWDDSGNTWQFLSGTAGIPDATAGSGGNTKGKLTVDSDLGLQLLSGVLGIDLSGTPGLQFSGGDLEVLEDPNGGIEIVAAGVAVKLNGTTLAKASAGLSVLGLPGLFTISGSAVSSNVTAANLDELTGSGSTTLHSHAGSDESSRVENDITAATGGIAIGDPVFVNASNEVEPADNATVAEARGFVGICRLATTAASAAPIVSSGRVNGVLSSATPGAVQYLSSPNGITSTRPTASGAAIVSLGKALNADDLMMMPQYLGRVA